MSITVDPGDIFFPYNAMFVLEGNLRAMDPALNIFRRRLSVSDPDGSVGLIPVNWTGVASEIGRNEPPIQTYTLFVQTLIVDGDEARGLRSHSYFAKRVRELLARNGTLRVGLSQLEAFDQDNGTKEKTSRFFVGEQVFHDANEDGNFRYLSTAELQLETQITNA